MNAEEAKEMADKAISELPITKAINNLIENAAASGEVSVDYHSDDLPSRIRIFFEERGFTFEYNKFTFVYTISWA